MGNLGAYQVITVAAKKAGGVAPYIRTIETNAVLRAAPKLIAAGFAGGIGATLAFTRFAEIKQEAHARSETARATFTQLWQNAIDQPETDPDPEALPET